METINMIIGISGVALSAASLLAMVFGIRLGKKALSKSETLYGEEAEKRYNAIKDKLAKPYSDIKYDGRNKITPQFEVERNYYQPQTMEDALKGINKIVRYYYKDADGQTMVKTWRLK
ncbi:hypothetical protein FACS189485_09370 [Spirochaetia bacterium]|nr:hypothetical protein FACS189485_09370 [Spirochaetia bacterium]